MTKFTLLYISIVSSLFAFTFFVLFRLIPFDFNHIVYICQSYVGSVPDSILLSIFLLIVLLLIRVFVTFFKTNVFKNNLKEISKPVFLQSLESKYNIIGKIHVFEYSQPHAFCIGIINPKIYLSSISLQIMSKQQVEAVILHEMYHLKRHDNFFLIILNIVAFLLFPFPIVKELKYYFELKEEIDADKFSVSNLGSTTPILQSLKKFLSYKPDNVRYGISFLKLKTLHHRISSLRNETAAASLIKSRSIVTTFISIIVLSSLLFIPISKTEIHANNEDVMVLCTSQ